MTYNDVLEMLEQIGLPFAYDHFAEGEMPEVPFLVFRYPESHNFSADGIVYHLGRRLQAEVYSDKKDPTLEDAVESVFYLHGLFYQKSEVWIESERLYEVLYTLEV